MRKFQYQWPQMNSLIKNASVRALLSTAIFALCAEASAQMSNIFPTLPSFKPPEAVQEKFRQALGIKNPASSPSWKIGSDKGFELRRAGRFEEAADAFKQAFAELRQQEASNDESQQRGVIFFGVARMELLRGYGDVLNQLNRPDEALPLLLQIDGIEQADLDRRAQERSKQTFPSPPPSISFFDVTAALKSAFSNAQYLVRDMSRKRMIYESDSAIPYEESLAERLPETQLTALALADAYSRKGDKQAVLKLYDGKFQDYLRRQRENNNSDARQNLDDAIETACIRFALILSRVGPNKQQDDAFKCALDLNLVNQRISGTSALVEGIQEGFASKRRLYVAAFTDQRLRNAAADANVQRHIVELIADSKGLSARYVQRVRQLVFHSDSSALLRLRPKFDALEKARSDLPVTGNESVAAMVNWENARAALMRDALPQLNKEGLGDIFIDGATLLNRAQQKLGDAALIGFSIYKPIDLNTMAPLPGRVIRYSVTKSNVELKDIGTQKDLESLVYRWRSAVAAGTDTTAIPLSEHLLGELPTLVEKSKSWVIDPDGAISLIPFEALRERAGNPVIAGHSVRYVTSIASFANSTTSSIKSGPTAIIIANPQFANTTIFNGISRSVPTASGALLENMNFSQLPNTKEEAESVETALTRLGVSSVMRLGNNATVESLDFTVGPRYLHIATHGIYMAPGTDRNSKEFIRVATSVPGMQSALVFTPSSRGSIFTGADFARLPLNGTELVVLSACDTGNGTVNVGEGVASLRMAVEEAGAQSSVTSLWPVPSDATARLMGAFYAQLGLGNSKVESLRLAKLQLMKTHPEPANWAGFLLSGQP